MSNIYKNIKNIEDQLNSSCKVLAVSKRQSNEKIFEAYQNGFKRFGENYVQELVAKEKDLPKDIEWHMIGHLQSNKVKYIAPFISLIHSIDSYKLLKEINKQALKNDRIINCLLQVHVAEEQTKSGLKEQGLFELLKNDIEELENIKVVGIMGMSTFTDNHTQVASEFEKLKGIFDKVKKNYPSLPISELSMGMSGDWKIAEKKGSTLIRVGSSIFGSRT